MLKPRVLQIECNFRGVMRIAEVLRHGAGYSKDAGFSLFSLCSADKFKLSTRAWNMLFRWGLCYPAQSPRVQKAVLTKNSLYILTLNSGVSL